MREGRPRAHRKRCGPLRAAGDDALVDNRLAGCGGRRLRDEDDEDDDEDEDESDVDLSLDELDFSEELLLEVSLELVLSELDLAEPFAELFADSRLSVR